MDDDRTRISRTDLLARGAGALAGGLLLGTGLGRSLLEDVARAAELSPTPTLVMRDEPLALLGAGGRARVLAARPAPAFDLLGVHWQGPGSVDFRIRERGRWGSWQHARVHELPDPDTTESADVWRLGTPVWAPGAGAVEYRVAGRVTALRSHFVRSPAAEPERRLERRGEQAPAPAIVTRAAWGADEALVRAQSAYADQVRFAIVHHSAGKAPKSPAESAAQVRGIQTYHVVSNGWNDIGYNFLVDGFGQVFEGRVGGVDRNVIGAHALGFNTGSVGVCVLGNFENQLVPAGAISAIVQLLAWRLDLAHVDPLAVVSAVSTAGETRSVRAVSGHRDVNATACPGESLYPELGSIATQVSAIGLPKLFEPAVARSGRLVRFTARLSSPLGWAVTVTDAAGAPLASGSGADQLVDWTWDASLVPDGRYGWTIAAGTARSATGSVTLGTPVQEVEDPAAAPPPRPSRPTGVPRRLPRWAWELRRWHLGAKATRGPRPASAPRRLPAWYWPWYRWTLELERWQRDYGPAAG